VEPRAAQARREHRAAAESDAAAARHRENRDTLIRQLRRDDPDTWSYSALARLLGCSSELIAKIVKPQRH